MNFRSLLQRRINRGICTHRFPRFHRKHGPQCLYARIRGEHGGALNHRTGIQADTQQRRKVPSTIITPDTNTLFISKLVIKRRA